MNDVNHVIKIGPESEMQVSLNTEKMIDSMADQKFDVVEADLNIFNKGKLQKQKVRKYFEAQEIKWAQLLDLYYKAHLTKKEVELKALSIKAEKYVMKLEKEHRELMEQAALEEEDKTMTLLFNFGVMVSKHLKRATHTEELLEEIREEVIEAIRYRKQITFKRIRNGLDSFINDLDQKYQAQQTKKLKLK